LRLIVEGQVGPVDAVKAYHAVLGKLGLRPHRSLEADLQLTDQAMSYGGKPGASVSVPKSEPAPPRVISTPSSPSTISSNGAAHCHCHDQPAPTTTTKAADCGCHGRSVVTESITAVSRYNHILGNGHSSSTNGRPDFTKMSPPERLAYHRQRLGLGR
jgi:hypothetical protein